MVVNAKIKAAQRMVALIMLLDVRMEHWNHQANDMWPFGALEPGRSSSRFPFCKKIKEGPVMKALLMLFSAFSAFSVLASSAVAQVSSDRAMGSVNKSSSTTEEIPLDLSESAREVDDAVEIQSDQQSQSGGGDIQIEESAILPSTDDFLESEAPTMDLDCERNDNCLDTLTDPAEGPVLSSPDAVDTPAVETQETERVVTEP